MSVRGSLVRGESASSTSASGKRGAANPCLRPSRSRTHKHRERSSTTHCNDDRTFDGSTRGGILSSDFCDADPYLVKAATFHGEATDEDCPACHSVNLVTLNYVYGDELGPYSGRIRETENLPSLAHRFGDIGVYVVEVCPDCHWNYLLRTYRIGDGTVRRALPRLPTSGNSISPLLPH